MASAAAAVSAGRSVREEAALSAAGGGDALDAGVRGPELLGVGLPLEGGEGCGRVRGACGVPQVSHASSRSFGLDIGVTCVWWWVAESLEGLEGAFASGVVASKPFSCQKDVPMSIRGSGACVVLDGFVRDDEPDVRR